MKKVLLQLAALNDNTFCLKIDDDNTLHLDHKYYYQVQTQMFVCNVNYCDFCVYKYMCKQSSRAVNTVKFGTLLVLPKRYISIKFGTIPGKIEENMTNSR